MTGPPGLMTTAVQPQHTARIGENFRFLCPIRADPEPIFEWYRVRMKNYPTIRKSKRIKFKQDGNRIPGHWERYKFLNRGNTLSIQRLECEDEGTYTCKGINGFGAQQINFQLTLLGIHYNANWLLSVQHLIYTFGGNNRWLVEARMQRGERGR